MYRPVVYRLALMQRTLVERFPQEYTQFVEANRREVARFVSQTFIDRAKFPRLAYPALDGFLPPFINPLTAWFTQHLFQGTVQEFHAWLLELQAKGESWEGIKGVADAGYTYGYFSPQHPRYAEYVSVFSFYLGEKSLPAYMQHEAPEWNTTSLDPDFVERLKRFWPTAYTPAFVAQEERDNQSNGYLSNRDHEIAWRSLFISDQRTAPTRRAAEASAARMTLQGQPAAMGQEYVHQYDQQTFQLEAQAQQKQHQLHAAWHTLLQDLGAQAWTAQSGVMPRSWSHFRSHSGRLFQVTLSHAQALLAETDDQKRLAVVAALNQDLLQTLQPVVDQATEGWASLFGEKFHSCDPLQQTMLILFSALTITRETKASFQVVWFISQQLQPLFERHQGADHVRTPVPSSSWHFQPEQTAKVERQARQRLESEETLSEGVASLAHPQIQAWVESRFHSSEEFPYLLAEPSNFQGRFLNFAEVLYSTYYLVYFSSLENKPGEGPIFLVVALLALLQVWALNRLLIAKEQQEFRRLAILPASYEPGLENMRVSQRGRRRALRVFLVGMLIMYGFFHWDTFVDWRSSDDEASASRPSSLIQSESNENTDLPGERGLTRSLFDSIHAQQYGDLQTPSGDNQTPGSSSEPRNSGEVQDNQIWQSLPIPESISSEDLEHVQPRVEGQVIHLPEALANQPFPTVGYQSKAWIDAQNWSISDANYEPLEFWQRVDQIGPDLYVAQPDELVRTYDPIPFQIFPLDGWEITQVFQVGGDEPRKGQETGAVYYSGTRPQALMVVQRPVAPIGEKSGQHFQYFAGSAPRYFVDSTWASQRKRAFELNFDLRFEAELQAIQAAHIRSMDTIYAEGQGMIAQADEVFELKFRENLDGIVAYMQGRNYSLQFRSTINLSGSYTILRTIAQEPQLGFYCLVGNQALQQYLSSLNIPSVLQPGNTLYVIDGYLVSRISHVNTRVFLPNGDVILADATPRKAQPGEDVSVLSLDWLETYTPPPPEQGEKSEHHEATVSPLELLLLASASLGLASTAWGYQYWHTWRRQRGQRLSRIERQLSQDPGEAQQELQALRHALVYFWDAGPQIKPEEQAQSPSFYTRLAQDMISFLTQENNATTNLPPTVVSILALSDPWQNSSPLLRMRLRICCICWMKNLSSPTTFVSYVERCGTFTRQRKKNQP